MDATTLPTSWTPLPLTRRELRKLDELTAKTLTGAWTDSALVSTDRKALAREA